MFIYRLHRKRRAASDYSGTLLIAQRWNPAGVGMLYCASNLSLAVLEVLVHTDKRIIPDDYVWSMASVGDLPSSPLVEGRGLAPLHVPSLPRLEVITERIQDVGYTRSVGRQWILSGREVAVMVPSVIVPTEMNVLLNPAHEDYSGIKWQDPTPFVFDPRLFEQSIQP